MEFHSGIAMLSTKCEHANMLNLSIAWEEPETSPGEKATLEYLPDEKKI